MSDYIGEETVSTLPKAGGVTATIDYLRVTFAYQGITKGYRQADDKDEIFPPRDNEPVPVTLSLLTEALNLEPVTPLGYGRRFYKEAGVSGKVSFAWGGTRTKRGEWETVCMELTGQACRDLEARKVVGPGGKYETWQELLSYLLLLEGHVTRLDVAFDDRSGALDIAVMREAWENEQVVTRWDKLDPRGPVAKKKEERQGLSGIYFGSRQSEVFCRVYDKKREQEETGKVDAGEVSGPWVRLELEFKGERAQAMARRIEADGEACFAGVLRSYIDFKKPDHSRIERCSMADWWAAFVGDVEKVKLSVVKAAATIRRKLRWLRRGVAKTLAQVTELWGTWSDGDLTELSLLCEEGRGKMKKPDWELIEEYRREVASEAAIRAARDAWEASKRLEVRGLAPAV